MPKISHQATPFIARRCKSWLCKEICVIDMLTFGEFTVVKCLLIFLVTCVMGAIGGAVGGMLVGGKDLGYELSAMMGAFFGPLAAVPGVVVGLLLLVVV